jgi:hypothetical protein
MLCLAPDTAGDNDDIARRGGFEPMLGVGTGLMVLVLPVG